MAATSQTEIRIMKLINNEHPNIVHMHCAVDQPLWTYMVLDYFPRGDLSGIKLKPKHVIPLVRQLASVMAFLQVKQMVHRDIKPANMLLDEGKSLILIDFGLAIVLPPGSVLTARAGSQAYLAPELLQGQGRGMIPKSIYGQSC